jgi:hypothetical protein
MVVPSQRYMEPSSDFASARTIKGHHHQETGRQSTNEFRSVATAALTLSGNPGIRLSTSLRGTEAGSNCVREILRCVCLLLQDLIQSCARGGRRIVEDMCYEIRRADKLNCHTLGLSAGKFSNAPLLWFALHLFFCNYCRTYDKAVCLGGGGWWRTCAMRYDEPRLAWTCLTTTH